jgi:hypothetical protein
MSAPAGAAFRYSISKSPERRANVLSSQGLAVARPISDGETSAATSRSARRVSRSPASDDVQPLALRCTAEMQVGRSQKPHHRNCCHKRSKKSVRYIVHKSAAKLRLSFEIGIFRILPSTLAPHLKARCLASGQTSVIIDSKSLVGRPRAEASRRGRRKRGLTSPRRIMRTSNRGRCRRSCHCGDNSKCRSEGAKSRITRSRNYCHKRSNCKAERTLHRTDKCGKAMDLF